MAKDVPDIAALVELHRAAERKEEERRKEAEKAEAEAVKESDASALARSRDGRFLPGASANPGGAKVVREGRAKSLAKILSEETDDGWEFVERMLKFARGHVPGMSPKEQFEVNRYLFERLAGKTPDTVLVADVTSHPALDALTVEELRRIASGGDDDA